MNQNLLSACKLSMPEIFGNSNLATTCTIVDEYKFYCETYFHEISLFVDDLLLSLEPDSTMRTFQMSPAQKDQCNTHLDPEVYRYFQCNIYGYDFRLHGSC